MQELHSLRQVCEIALANSESDVWKRFDFAVSRNKKGEMVMGRKLSD